MILHGYWRSGAAYRVRIALTLKGIAYDQATHDLRTGAQAEPAYAALNPQKLVPALEVDGAVITQSAAIIEWLDEMHPDPALLPGGAMGRAIVRGMAAVIGTDTHPLHNLRVLRDLRMRFSADEAAVNDWARHWLAEGLAALESQVARYGEGFAYGSSPTMADCYVVPALYSAERFGVDTAAFPAVVAAGARTAMLAEAAHPSRQPGADRQ